MARMILALLLLRITWAPCWGCDKMTGNVIGTTSAGLMITRLDNGKLIVTNAADVTESHWVEQLAD